MIKIFLFSLILLISCKPENKKNKKQIKNQPLNQTTNVNNNENISKDLVRTNSYSLTTNSNYNNRPQFNPTPNNSQVTDEQIKSYMNTYNNDYNDTTIKLIRSDALKYGVSASQIEKAMGFPKGIVQWAFDVSQIETFKITSEEEAEQYLLNYPDLQSFYNQYHKGSALLPLAS